MTQDTDTIIKSNANSPHSVPLDELDALCRTARCVLAPEALRKLAVYMELLTQWNKVINLVGAQSWESTLLRLVADSFYLGHFLETLPLPTGDESAPHTWDLGAGAGLPGIPLRMVWEAGSYSLVEAREKRALFLSTVLTRVHLPRTAVFRGRAEDFFARQAQPADLIVSRAFLPWLQVLDLVEPVLAPQGLVVFLTSEAASDEMFVGLRGTWILHSQHGYSVAGRKRWFWAVARA